jgi:hypothetical protein
MVVASGLGTSGARCLMYTKHVDLNTDLYLSEVPELSSVYFTEDRHNGWVLYALLTFEQDFTLTACQISDHPDFGYKPLEIQLQTRGRAFRWNGSTFRPSYVLCALAWLQNRGKVVIFEKVDLGLNVVATNRQHDVTSAG